MLNVNSALERADWLPKKENRVERHDRKYKAVIMELFDSIDRQVHISLDVWILVERVDSERNIADFHDSAPTPNFPPSTPRVFAQVTYSSQNGWSSSDPTMFEQEVENPKELADQIKLWRGKGPIGKIHNTLWRLVSGVNFSNFYKLQDEELHTMQPDTQSKIKNIMAWSRTSIRDGTVYSIFNVRTTIDAFIPSFLGKTRESRVLPSILPLLPACFIF